MATDGEKIVQSDIASRIVTVLQSALLDNVEELTKKKFTGILSIKLDCAFNEGGLRNISKEISHKEIIQREKSL